MLHFLDVKHLIFNKKLNLMYETFGSVSLALLLSADNVKNTVRATKIRPSTNSSGNHTLIQENITQVAVGI